MAFRTYEVEIKGASPFLMHGDNLTEIDEINAWRKDPENKKFKVAGDDRSPAWTYYAYIYHDNKRLCIPSDNLMTCLREGGAMVEVPNGRRGKTFKAQTQSGMMVNEAFWPIVNVNGDEIPLKPFADLRGNMDFDKHMAEAKTHGFELFVKRAKIGQSKHVRVRPRFNHWSASGTVSVWDDQITEEALSSILEMAGQYKGIGDWRPSSKTPGVFGRFAATVKYVGKT